jgi:hypothetical protein
MIIDCCTFLNELDMLEARLEYLNDHVDYFVVVESNYTFNGNEKPFHIKANMDRFAKYGDRFIYLPLELSIAGFDFTKLEERNQWAMERQQRNAMAQPLDRFAPDDIVIFGDLDEIPNRNMIESAANIIRNGQRIVAFDQDFFYFNFNQINAAKWPGTLISTVNQVRAFTPDLFRFHRYTYPRIANGGWHLSYWGSPRQIQYKIDNFSHQEVNLPHLNNVDNILESITQGKDLYNRPEEQWARNDRSTLDPEMLDIFSRLEYKI